jgi:hypothetical protein
LIVGMKPFTFFVTGCPAVTVREPWLCNTKGPGGRTPWPQVSDTVQLCPTRNGEKPTESTLCPGAERAAYTLAALAGQWQRGRRFSAPRIDLLPGNPPAILNPIFRPVLHWQIMPPLPLRPAMPTPMTGLAMAAILFAALTALLSGWSAAAATAACIMAVAAAIGRQHLVMSLWFGIAIAFGGHALLLAPFFVAIAIRHRAGIRAWLAAPSIWLAASLAWLIAGWRPAGLDLSAAGAPAIWSLAAATMPDHLLQLLGLALAAALGAIAAFAARMQVVPMDRAGMIGMAGLSALLTAGLLPGMRPDAFILAATLTLACAAIRPNRSTLLVAGLVQAGFFIAISTAPEPGVPGIAIAALCMVAATWIAAQPLIAPHANDNRDGSHRIPPAYGLRGTLSFDMMSARPARPRGE